MQLRRRWPIRLPQVLRAQIAGENRQEDQVIDRPCRHLMSGGKNRRGGWAARGRRGSWGTEAIARPTARAGWLQEDDARVGRRMRGVETRAAAGGLAGWLVGWREGVSAGERAGGLARWRPVLRLRRFCCGWCWPVPCVAAGQAREMLIWVGRSGIGRGPVAQVGWGVGEQRWAAWRPGGG
jgi:hypothetical protein